MQIKIMIGGPYRDHVVVERAARVAGLAARVYTPRLYPLLLQAGHHSPAWAVAFTVRIDDAPIAAVLHVITERSKPCQMLNIGILEVSPLRIFFPHVVLFPLLNLFYPLRKRFSHDVFCGFFFGGR